MYEKTKYTFYKKDGKTQIPLTEQNIKSTTVGANYKIVNGALIVTNPNYNTDQKFDSVSEQIAISPKDNIFTMGNDYILKITPIVTINQNDECEIENNLDEFS